MNGPVVVVGAGQAGALLSIYLARQGLDVMLYESRPDLRRTDIDAGRSINLALATRGIVPLIDVGVIEHVDAITIPMRGRMIHAVGDPTPDLQPYGTKMHEVIHSVSRTDLNAILLDAAEATGRVTVKFDARLDSVDFDRSELRFTDDTTAPFGVLFGADGAGSRVRKAIAARGACSFETEWLDHDYKELTLPPADDGGFRLDQNALHIWPRGEFMLIALANPEGDFTVTLFAPKATFEALTTGSEIAAFFADQFGDFAELVPDLVEQFLENPTGPLGTMRATGWSLDGRAVLVGDAAHAIVPFHGQGMNLAMESVRALDRHLRASPDDIATAFANYEADRKPNADAIADMALDNYVEMRAGVIDPNYVAKRTLALELQQRHPGPSQPSLQHGDVLDHAIRRSQRPGIGPGRNHRRSHRRPVDRRRRAGRSTARPPGTGPSGRPESPLNLMSLPFETGDDFTYGSYLKVSELLSLQQCVSLDEDSGQPEHDETLFIIIHQVYELWFKQLLHEMDHIVALLNAHKVNAARHHLKRVLKILKTLVGQIDILETMTPAEFASFRSFLANASGFQSAQFRELEFMLGIKNRVQIDWFHGDEALRLNERFEAPTLWDAFVGLLHRDGHDVPADVLQRDVREPITANEGLQAIIVSVYSDDGFAGLCETLTDLDEGLQEWRYRHVMMVRRTIGTKPGTGGSDGASYLATTLFQPAFPDLWAIRTAF